MYTNWVSSILYECVLPWPPSINKAYGGGSGQQRFKSKHYKEWEKNCPELILPECGAIDWPVSVELNLYMPDNRKRDIDNSVKVVMDQLVKQCIFMDDNHKIVQEITVRFCGVDKGSSRVEILIKEL